MSVRLACASLLAVAALSGCATTAAHVTSAAPGAADGAFDPSVRDGVLDPGTELPTSVTTTTWTPVDPASDVVNVAARAELAAGLVMELRVNSRQLLLEGIALMQVRAVPRGDDVTVTRREGRIVPRADGDWLIVEAFASDGRLVSRTAVSDSPIDIVEEEGAVAVEERFIYASLPTPRRVATLALTSTVNGLTETVDITSVFDTYCADNPETRLCQTPE